MSQELVSGASFEFKTSDTTAALDAALAKAQGEITSAAKDKINPHFKSKYADLSDVWNACRIALSKNGISVTQWPVHSVDGRLHLITRLAFSGEWMISHFSIPAPKLDAQGYGSAITYIKRFTLSSAVGVAAEDDDGNAATAVKPHTFAPATPNAQTPEEMQRLLADSLEYARATREVVSKLDSLEALEAAWTSHADTQAKQSVARPIFAEKKSQIVDAAKKRVKDMA